MPLIAPRNRTVFITIGDGPDGVGAQIARRVGSTGDSIVIAGPHTYGHTLAAEIRSSGADVRFLHADLRDLIEMAQAVDRAGPVDMLVNDASSFAAPANFASVSAEADSDRLGDWYEMTFSALFLSCAFLPSMALRGGGHIVHVDRSAVPGNSRKLESLTRKWSGRWAAQHVRVHSISTAVEIAPTTAGVGAPTAGADWADRVADTVVSLNASRSDATSGETIRVSAQPHGLSA